ncbi:hypothetical protein Ddye_026152 [Dipteronia dyeriana]|uniref:Nuclease HARBI1 n=1 Tax=Dipteronia dyeriana TaxID=168575 RepID=A0AAD9WQ55_9ROSI|nr:hypothetical protein Ddye_026152 [Dipteronia dyeriana]
MFHRRFRMGQNLFLCIVNVVEARDNYFVQQRDAMVRLGLSALQKITVVYRMLAYSLPTDATDEYIKIGESTTIESLKRFCRVVVEVFAQQYLRSPNADDVAKLLRIDKYRGFSGMLGSLDCMHWKWKNCPTAWTGQYAGRSGSPTIILEDVSDYDLWIWHAFFGLPGSNNDINVLEVSHLFVNLAEGGGTKQRKGDMCSGAGKRAGGRVRDVVVEDKWICCGNLKSNNEIPSSVQEILAQDAILEVSETEELFGMSESDIERRMDLENTDYPGTGANNHHDPKTPGRI